MKASRDKTIHDVAEHRNPDIVFPNPKELNATIIENAVTVNGTWDLYFPASPYSYNAIHTMKTIKNNCSAGIRIMFTAWKKRQAMSGEIEWFQSSIIPILICHHHYSFTVPVPCSQYPISPCPRESTRLRKTGTIWKQNWHHCKQWNHMRVDSHWTFTQNTRAYTVLLRMFTVRRWFDSTRTSCILAQQQRIVWKEFIISGIIDCGIPRMTRTPANWIMDCTRRTYIWAMKPLSFTMISKYENLG